MTYEQNLTCFTTFGEDPSWTLEVYEKYGGYEAWRKILAGGMTPDEIIDEVKASTRCISGQVQRYQPMQATGDCLDMTLDFNTSPASIIGTGTRYFQAWFRDTGDTMFGFQMSDGLCIDFEP